MKTTSHTIVSKKLDESSAAVTTPFSPPSIANSTVHTLLNAIFWDASRHRFGQPGFAPPDDIDDASPCPQVVQEARDCGWSKVQWCWRVVRLLRYQRNCRRTHSGWPHTQDPPSTVPASCSPPSLPCRSCLVDCSRAFERHPCLSRSPEPQCLGATIRDPVLSLFKREAIECREARRPHAHHSRTSTRRHGAIAKDLHSCVSAIVSVPVACQRYRVLSPTTGVLVFTASVDPSPCTPPAAPGICWLMRHRFVNASSLRST